MSNYELALSDQQFKEAVLFLFVQINANTLAMHDHFLRFQAKDNEHHTKLIKEAFKLREMYLNQMLANLYGKYGDVDWGALNPNPQA